ncbi:glycosyltransferase [Algoriphagus pacificus]|uniref:Glycosyltransferase n=1 Tax=Algoriphagus pacificus TaxID=2811234 RepID=A0ABS3CMT4_9BACT|nr:glycosyltransferase [Algoriphagus pacificus]MBN7817555.1 glycosyltransferase [Algoriphagus pacificus]
MKENSNEPTVSVVIRNKNEKPILAFLLKVLRERYQSQILEIIVIDNLSTDGSQEMAEKMGARVVTIKDFSYGKSANLAMESSSGDLVTIMSAHSYPVSHDFFTIIKQQFIGRDDLAGVRCLHFHGDYRKYLNGTTWREDLNGCGLTFACSVVNKKMWLEEKFVDDIQQCEDKEWTKRMVAKGYTVEFTPAIYCYEIRRTRKQLFTRFKNDIIINYQLWGEDMNFSGVIRKFAATNFYLVKDFFVEFYYNFKRTFWLFSFVSNKPKKKY